MGAPQSTSRPSPPRPSSRRPKAPTSEEHRTVLGLGVPVAPSFLVLDDEETKAYDVREAQGVSLSKLLAECQPEMADESSSAPSTVQPRGASFHTVPHFPDDSSPVIEVAESNLHEIHDDLIEDALGRPSSKPPVAEGEWIKAWSRPPEPISDAPASRPLPSPRRSWFAKFVFAIIAIAAVVLLASELAAAAKIPWLDARPVLTKGLKLAKEKIPWERLPKLPSF